MSQEQTRPLMMSWLKSAAMRIREGNNTILDNGKNELDVMMGCSTPAETIQSIFECSVLGQTNETIRNTYQKEFSRAIGDIHETNPEKAQKLLEEAKTIGKETPWLWYSAVDTSNNLG
jgi:hypothetical protein